MYDELPGLEGYAPSGEEGYASSGGDGYAPYGGGDAAYGDTAKTYGRRVSSYNDDGSSCGEGRAATATSTAYMQGYPPYGSYKEAYRTFSSAYSDDLDLDDLSSPKCTNGQYRGYQQPDLCNGQYRGYQQPSTPRDLQYDVMRQSTSLTLSSCSSSSVFGAARAVEDLDLDVANRDVRFGGNFLKEFMIGREQLRGSRDSDVESCKSEREEIRRRLAMTGEDDVTEEGPTERLKTRLSSQSGMQICFMAEEEDEEEDDDVITANLEDAEQTPTSAHPYFPGDPAHQTRLQTEATLALAQASTMARMQLEVDRQAKKKSPVADMVGIPSLGAGRRLQLTCTKLREMNIAQLQVLVNDLHSQIELLNEDLVHQLIMRDDLHMEQDSMLVDIEDLTSHCHDNQATNNNKSSHNNNRHSGQYKEQRR